MKKPQDPAEPEEKVVNHDSGARDIYIDFPFVLGVEMDKSWAGDGRLLQRMFFSWSTPYGWPEVINASLENRWVCFADHERVSPLMGFAF